MRIMQKTSLLTSAAVMVFGLQAQAQEQITYADHVAQIITDNCVVCHQEGGIGPMQFTSYEQVRPWAPLIQMKVANREMPPYAYDHGIGIQDLQGDWRLAQEDIDTIVNWVSQGAPLGDWGDRSHPIADVRDPNEWNFTEDYGKPDLVVASTPIDIPANGNDMWHSPYNQIDNPSDRCIQAMQVKPQAQSKAVVHHANTSVEVLNEDGEYERHSQLNEYAMGKWGEVIPEGVCRTLPKDSRVKWTIHLFPGGVGPTAEGQIIENNVVELGLWLHDEGYETVAPYKQDLASYGIREGYVGGELIIPPHGTIMTQGFHSFDHPIRLDSFQPHGHLRMNAASLEIFYPETGRTEAISQISKWSATWHHSHLYETESAPLLPAGAVLVIKQWYDNTANNPNNPDPDQWVFGGSRTGDEMSHAWLAITHLDDEGYEALLSEREATDAD